ncbi:putative receptor-like protein kinase At2g23200 [Bidens hawaiensis]|uniref:putative receptor-like protein kinase At2g23200 n=1 Tax=Bidens hawaiensis TaxID=980011 RepID=UPI0040494867
MASTAIMEFAHLQIPLEDIQKATNNFHQDNIIGRGDFGTAYKGQLIKISAHEKIIVTTYEAKGSLGQFLNNPNFTWTQRLRVCVGVARALSYLHSGKGRGCGVIHRLINSSTILLDENWEAKLSSFEISIKQSIRQMDRVTLSEPTGTIGYMDPSVIKTRGVTRKSDVYSFGVVLFEILCGRKAFIQNEPNMFLDSLAKSHYINETLQEIVHPDLYNQMTPKSLVVYSKVAYSCLEEEESHRPDMSDIVGELEKALEAHTRGENLVRSLVIGH